MEHTISTAISWNGARRIPYVSLLFGGLALLLHATGGAARFAFDLVDHNWSHAFIAHWAHWSTDHLLWSGGAFVILGALCEMRDRFTAAALMIASALLISLGVVLFPSGMSAYAGLSGIDSAFFGWLVIQLHLSLSEKADTPIKWVPLLCGVGFILKMGYEFITGQAFFVHSEKAMMAVPLAHLVGFATGLLFGMRVEEE
jgi:hypothetical protein